MKKPERKLSPVVGRYFAAWIDRRTWDSQHSLDTAMFYHFVKAVARYSRRVPSQADVYALIIKRRRGQVSDSIELDKIAKDFAARYATLLDYEKTKGFPNPLIERTDIAKYYVAMRGEKQYINGRMTEVWGKDWRMKLDQEIKKSSGIPMRQ